MPHSAQNAPEPIEGAQPSLAMLIEQLAGWRHIPGLNSTWLAHDAVLMQAEGGAVDPEAPLVIDVVGVADHQNHPGWVLMLD